MEGVGTGVFVVVGVRIDMVSIIIVVSELVEISEEELEEIEELVEAVEEGGFEVIRAVVEGTGTKVLPGAVGGAVEGIAPEGRNTVVVTKTVVTALGATKVVVKTEF
ncbi:hypothetical protein OQA88_6966 [Cercophora sp. LCS_1]